MSVCNSSASLHLTLPPSTHLHHSGHTHHRRANSTPNFPLSLLFSTLSLDSPSTTESGIVKSYSPTSHSRRRRLLRRHTRAMGAQPEDRVDMQYPSSTNRGPDETIAQASNAEPTHHSSPSRNSPYAKRFASLDTPREDPILSHPHRVDTASHVGLAFLYSGLQGAELTAAPVDHENGAGRFSEHSTHSLPLLSLPQSSRLDQDYLLSPKHMTASIDKLQCTEESMDPAPDQDYQVQTSPGRNPNIEPQTAPIFTFSRPYSLQEAHTNSFGPPAITQPTWPDRSSFSSLPLPMQTPYFTLPRATGTLEEGHEWKRGTASQDRFPPEPKFDPSQRLASTSPPHSAIPTAGTTQPWLSHHPTAIRSNSHGPRSMSSASSHSYPAPDPPTILPHPPNETASEGARNRAPYEPFLSHAPPPEDSWIAVETSMTEYRLIVRLPGFRRDGITLATRRRRVLHVVADSWEPTGGGHFERRISFGYDADLGQVRAEFDGELLKIAIPRRLPPISTWHSPAPSTS